MCAHRLFTLALIGLELEIAPLTRLSGSRPELNAHISELFGSGVYSDPKTLRNVALEPTGVLKNIFYCLFVLLLIVCAFRTDFHIYFIYILISYIKYFNLFMYLF